MARNNAANLFEQYRYYLIPSVIGGIVAWIFSGSLMLGILVFIGVWVGNWVGMELLKKK